MAYDLAEQQIANGTASSQVISHFLKLGSPKAKKEMELLEKQCQLTEAKIQSIKSMGSMDELYKKALDAMQSYKSGSESYED